MAVLIFYIEGMENNMISTYKFGETDNVNFDENLNESIAHNWRREYN